MNKQLREECKYAQNHQVYEKVPGIREWLFGRKLKAENQEPQVHKNMLMDKPTFERMMESKLNHNRNNP